LFVDSSGSIGVGGSAGFGAIDHGIHVTGSYSQEGIRLQTSAGSSGILEVYAESGGATLDTRGSGYIRFNNAGTEWARFDSSGRLGIGTTSPAHALHVSASLTGTTATTNVIATFRSQVAGRDANIQVGDPTDLVYLGSLSGNLYLATANLERLRITSAGLVGIGTSNPKSTIDISLTGTANIATTTITKVTDFGTSASFGFNGLVNNNDGVFFGMGAGGSGIPAGIGFMREAFGWNTALAFYTNNITSGPNGTNAIQEKVRIDSSGRLLVGTTSTTRSTLLQIVQTNQTINSGHGNFGVFTSDAQALNIGAKLTLGGQSGEANWLYASLSGRSENNGYAGYLQFGLSNSGGSHYEAARINSGGELLIGYTADNGPYLLQVNSQIFATSSTIATSDGRYKENVDTLNGCLDLVKALRPVSFEWKPQQDITRIDDEGNEVLVRESHNFPDGTQVGFIAQEVQEVLAEKPWLTSIIKENVRPAVTDNDGNKLAPEEKFLGIAEGNLIAVLTSALQEAIAKIEQLEAAVTTLQQS
jgi:hypothetical protein